ncbi:MAG TPA: cytochrome c [Thermoanaerobaculia bacterium]|nr:cytochrome c [Thermoanaerobaculia bacterium]
MNDARTLVSSSASLILALTFTACGGESAQTALAPEKPAPTTVTAELLGRGADVYKSNCIACHGPLGKGDGPSAATLDPKPRDHSSRAYMDQLSDQQIADTIVQGGALRGYPNMPSNPHIRGNDLAALVAHVRTLSRGPDEVRLVDLKQQ